MNHREQLGEEIRCVCAEKDAEIARLDRELKTIKDLVESHGSGQEFDWAVLGEINRLELDGEFYKAWAIALNKLAKKASDEIEQLKANQGIQWVSVEDGVPEKSGDYLFGYVGHKDFFTANFGYCDKTTKDSILANGWTHWAEINLPKGK